MAPADVDEDGAVTTSVTTRNAPHEEPSASLCERGIRRHPGHLESAGGGRSASTVAALEPPGQDRLVTALHSPGEPSSVQDKGHYPADVLISKVVK